MGLDPPTHFRVFLGFFELFYLDKTPKLFVTISDLYPFTGLVNMCKHCNGYRHHHLITPPFNPYASKHDYSRFYHVYSVLYVKSQLLGNKQIEQILLIFIDSKTTYDTYEISRHGGRYRKMHDELDVMNISIQPGQNPANEWGTIKS